MNALQQSYFKHKQNELSLPNKSLDGSIKNINTTSDKKSHCQFYEKSNFIPEEKLKDAFDANFIKKLKEEVKGDKRLAGESLNKQMKHLIKNILPKPPHTNLRTSTTTPDTRTPIRSPMLQDEKHMEKPSQFQRKIEVTDGKYF